MSHARRLWTRPSFDLAGKLCRVNWALVLLLTALAGVGYAALYSVGGGAPLPYAEPHALRFAAGLLLMFAVAAFPPRLLVRLAWPLYFGALLLLGAVLRFGHVGKGAQRWIALGGFQLQPSELMKIALVLALAAWFRHASREQVRSPLFLMPPVAAIAAPALLILKEPNLGTAVITACVGAAMLFAAGVRWWKFALVLLPVPLAAPLLYARLHDYQRARIDTFLHPENDPLGAGYNILQSKIALGSGGVWGEGYLHGTQAHLDFLPEKQTDFIFSIIGEEFGFAGGLGLMALLAAIVFVCMATALRCDSQFGRLLALGIAVNFSMYVFVNIAMAMGAIPVGGVPLPLVSHGGSAMLTVMFGFGLLMSVHVHRERADPDRPD